MGASKLGKLLLKARVKKGMGVRAVAKKVGCSFSSISRYETGMRIPSGDILLKLMKLLDLERDDLVNR